MVVFPLGFSPTLTTIVKRVEILSEFDCDGYCLIRPVADVKHGLVPDIYIFVIVVVVVGMVCGLL